MNKLNSRWNRIYRAVLGFKSWQSVKEIQMPCGRLDFAKFVEAIYNR